MEDEIDLRPYIRLLLQSWHWIVGIAFVAALSSWLIVSWQPDEYLATASVAIVRSRTDINFDPRIVDIIESDLTRTDLTSRRQALVALVLNNDIALSVLAELGSTLPPERRSVTSLLKIVEPNNEGDLINITVHSNDPKIAAAVANSWAQHYQNLVNNLYGGSGSFGVDGLEAQVQSAAITYKMAQHEVEIFIGTNHIIALKGEIAEQQQILNANRAALVAVQVEPINLQTTINQEILAGYYAVLQETEIWLADAKAFQALLENGSNSVGGDLGNVLALIGLQNRAFGAEAGIDLNIDVSIGVLEPVRANDIEAIIDVLEERQSLLAAQIQTLIEAWAEGAPQQIVLPNEHPLNSFVAELEEGIQTLEAELESQEAQQRELQQSRDLAWETYQSLTLKMSEETIAAKTVGTEVLLAEQAVPSQEPTNSSKLVIMALAIGTSIFLTIFLIFVNAWWQQTWVADED